MGDKMADTPDGALGPGFPRLLLWKRDLCAMLGVKVRTLERMISAGEIPAPDRHLRGRPAWLAATVQEWAANKCPAVMRKPA